MKYSAALILVFATFLSFAQTKDQRERNAGSYKYQTEFYDMNLNFVSVRVQNFLHEQLTMAQSADPIFEATDSSTLVVREIYSSALYEFEINYKCQPDGNDLIIKSVTINGSPDKVVKFFVEFWKTSLNFNDTKDKETVVSYFINDRVALTVDFIKSKGTIEIERR